MVHAERRTDARVIDKLPRILREDSQQTGHLPDLLDLGDIPHVALNDGLDVIEIPILPTYP